MTEELKTQWHPAFCSAMKLELIEDGEYLDYQSEYNLNTKPLQIDLLVVKKIKEIVIKNEIGRLFKKHNIIEYKSPKDSMNVNTFLQVIAYACLYKMYEEHVDDIRLDDITITLVREVKPVKLFRWFRENGYQVDKKYEGIFYVIKEGCFPTQIIVSKLLSKENQKWLTLLSSSLSQEDAERTVTQLNHLAHEVKELYGDSILQVALKENEEIFDKLKGDKDMCEALRKLMEPEIKEEVQKAKKDMLLNALKNGSSATEVARVMGIPLVEVEAVEKELLQLV
ncbi:MAG: hypothetical protein IJZ53_10415 [Tyzzerella sp.]|nr:hypothetical protein [Tyzzerella sp.]